MQSGKATCGGIAGMCPGEARTSMRSATLSLDGHYRVLGLYDTPEEAAQARDTAIIHLGLQDIAYLNNP